MAAPTPAGRIPWATWEPITNRSRVSNRPVRMTVHITAVRANDIYGPNKGPGNTYAHAHNSRNGDFRQHQELNKMAEADLDGNGETITIENEGREGDSLTDAQIENLARLFAYCVTEYGISNRIATVDDTRGLAWHRLGVSGNFGTYRASDMTTWSRAQTGKRWTKARGKTCPTDKVIRQIPEIYARAQEYINRGNPTSPSRPPAGTPTTPQEDVMTPEQQKAIDDRLTAVYNSLRKDIGRVESIATVTQRRVNEAALVDIVTQRRVNELLGRPAEVSVDVDPVELAASIADALPTDLAQQVVTELSNRLKES